MSLLGGRPFGSVFGNTSLNSSTSSFGFPRTSGLTFDKIYSSRSSTLRKCFFGPSLFIRSRFLPFVSPMDSDCTAALTLRFSCPQTTAKYSGVFFFTSLFIYLTEMICLSRDSLDVPFVFILFLLVLILPLLLLPFRVSFSPFRSLH